MVKMRRVFNIDTEDPAVDGVHVLGEGAVIAEHHEADPPARCRHRRWQMHHNLTLIRVEDRRIWFFCNTTNYDQIQTEQNQMPQTVFNIIIQRLNLHSYVLE